MYDGTFSHFYAYYSATIQRTINIKVTDNLFNIGEFLFFLNNLLFLKSLTVKFLKVFVECWFQILRLIFNFLDKTIVNIDFYAVGGITFDNNRMYNCTSIQDLISINSDDHIILSGNEFDTCQNHEGSFITLVGSMNIKFNSLIIANTTIDPTEIHGSVINISTDDLGVVVFNNLDFYNNTLESSIIEFGSTVGDLTIQNSTFYGESVTYDTEYILIDNPFAINIESVTVEN